MAGLLSRFETLLGAGAIATGREASSFLGRAPPRGAEPIVLSPGDASEVERILAISADASIAVFIAGSSSRGVDWDNLPRGRSVVLDMARLDALLGLDEMSMTVTTQSGIACAALERLLVKRGFSLGFGLSGFAERVSIGGLLATGLPPLASPARGTFPEHVVNVGFALPDGTRVRTRITPRAATGPDLDALVLGVRGVLGVITEATLRIHPVSDERALLGFGFVSVSDAILTLAEIVQAGLPPTFAGVWPAARGATRGARLAAQYSGSAPWTRALASAAKKALKDLGGRLDPKPDESWFAHADASAARLNGEHEPIWAWGHWRALAKAAASPALESPDAAFGVPAFDAHGGYAVATPGAARLAAFRTAGCRVLSSGRAVPEPFDEPSRLLLRRVKAELDPANRMNPGVLDG